MTGTRYFITATGTSQGKTLVTTALCWQLQRRGTKINALKPIVSGFDDAEASDTGLILRSLGRPVDEANLNAVSPWRFTAPLSPDYAAEREGVTLTMDAVVQFCEEASPASITLVEGAGGIMSPLTARHSNLDLLMRLDCPALLVSASYLGCITHVLTALKLLEANEIEVAGLIVNEAPDNLQLAEITLSSLRAHLPSTLPIKVIKALDGQSEIWKTAPDLTDLVLADV